MLEIGLRRPILWRHEQLEVGLSTPQSLIYASDLHLRRANGVQLAAEILWAARANQIPLVLLGGDLVDTPAGLPILAQTIALLRRRGVTVAGVSGNHDRWLGLNRIRDTVLRAGGAWLEDRPLPFGELWVTARAGQVPGPLLGIVCAHYPDHFPGSVRHGIPLTLAGHLHGGQVVLGRRGELMMPAGWFYRWNGLRFQELGSTLLVSRGMTDLVPLRFNCPRELLLVHLR